MTVVTISGQIGSGAREVGRLAAERLQLDYVDQEILVQAARELGVPVETVVSKDERTAGFGERIATMLRRFLERSAAAGVADPTMGPGSLDVLLGRTYAEAAASDGLPDVSDERYLATLCSVVRDLAGHDDVLIIGRGSQSILRDWPGACHILLVAPHERRVEFIVQRDGIDADEAAKRVRGGAKGRADFHRKFFKIDVDDPAHYHVAINTGSFSLDQSAAIIAEVAQRVVPAGGA